MKKLEAQHRTKTNGGRTYKENARKAMQGIQEREREND